MRPATLDRVPAPVLRIAAFTLAAVVVYAVLLGAGTLFFPSADARGSGYALSATVAAGIAAFYLVYLGGFAKVRDLIG